MYLDCKTYEELYFRNIKTELLKNNNNVLSIDFHKGVIKKSGITKTIYGTIQEKTGVYYEKKYY